MTPSEQAEYDRFARIVDRLDAEEEALCAKSVDHLIGKHERVLASIRRLTEAVEAAAART